MPVKTVFIILICFNAVIVAHSKFTGFIVGGELAKIEDYPYSVFTHKVCANESSTCGASILTQTILLTAAHCVVKCAPKGTFQNMVAYTESETKYKGHPTKVIAFKIHENYNHTNSLNDIALLKLEKELTFGTKAKRVALVKELPNFTNAIIAGWGWIDSKGTRGDYLKAATQALISYKKCFDLLGGIPLGTICGKDVTNYPEKGDSGSALVVDNYIQIGLVSFKKREYTNDTIIYTDVTYFYDWIMKTAADLTCAGAHTQTSNSSHTHLHDASNESPERCAFS